MSEIVLMGGPEELDCKVITIEGHFPGGFKSTFEWVGPPSREIYYYVFAENGRDYYLHVSEAKPNG
jgi:hypothetical protein